MESHLLDGMVCSTHSQEHNILSEEGVGDLLFPIDLGGPHMLAHFPLMPLRALRSKQLIL